MTMLASERCAANKSLLTRHNTISSFEKNHFTRNVLAKAIIGALATVGVASYAHATAYTVNDTGTYITGLTLVDGDSLTVTNTGQISDPAGINSTLSSSGIITIGPITINGSVLSVPGGGNTSLSQGTTITGGFTVGATGVIGYTSLSSVDVVTNNGSIGDAIDGLSLNGNITTLNNNAIITAGDGRIGVFLQENSGNSANVTNFTNSTTGSIFGGNYGIRLDDLTSIQTLINENGATITGTSRAGIYLGDFQNEGAGGASINLLQNAGSISSVTGDGIIIDGAEGGDVGTAAKIVTLENTGTISGINGITTTDSFGSSTTALLSELTNLGVITGTSGYGINNAEGTITTINNAQGGITPLTYTGVLPLNYNIILGATGNDYGKLSATAVTGTMSFGIYTGSTAVATEYAGVLTGVDSTNITSLSGAYSSSTPVALTGTYGGENWRLEETSFGSDTWNLVFGGASFSPNIPTPLLNASLKNISANTLLRVNQIVQSRLASNDGMNSGDVFYGDRHIWLKPFGTWADQDSRNGASGYKADTVGLVAGIDGVLSDKARVGLAFSYSKSDVDGDASASTSSVDINSYQLMGYGSYALATDAELNYQLGVGRNNNEGVRSLSGDNAYSDFHSTTAQAGVGIKRQYKVNEKTTIVPSFRADYTWVRDNGYTETNAGSNNLVVESSTAEQLIMGVEGKLNYAVNQNTTVSAKLGVGRDLIGDNNNVSVAYANTPGTIYSVNGLESGRTILSTGFGLTKTLENGAEIMASYDVESRSEFVNQALSARLRWNF